MEYSVIEPDVVIFAILLALYSVNQRLPSGPAVIPYGMLEEVVTAYSVIEPVASMVASVPLGEPCSIAKELWPKQKIVINETTRGNTNFLRFQFLIALSPFWIFVRFLYYDYVNNNIWILSMPRIASSKK